MDIRDYSESIPESWHGKGQFFIDQQEEFQQAHAAALLAASENISSAIRDAAETTARSQAALTQSVKQLTAEVGKLPEQVEQQTDAVKSHIAALVNRLTEIHNDSKAYPSELHQDLSPRGWDGTLPHFEADEPLTPEEYDDDKS